MVAIDGESSTTSFKGVSSTWDIFLSIGECLCLLAGDFKIDRPVEKLNRNLMKNNKMHKSDLVTLSYKLKIKIITFLHSISNTFSKMHLWHASKLLKVRLIMEKTGKL